jgi:hypothetical protein
MISRRLFNLFWSRKSRIFSQIKRVLIARVMVVFIVNKGEKLVSCKGAYWHCEAGMAAQFSGSLTLAIATKSPYPLPSNGKKAPPTWDVIGS